jgi:diadenosine tetraphosphate (Ap4A) HIT family hydrolase
MAQSSALHIASPAAAQAGDDVPDSAVDYRRLEIHSADGWIWQVHENQSYLGRMIFRLERAEHSSVGHCHDEEWLTLLRSIRRFERIWDTLFAPDLYNYGQLGNVYRQLHVHAVPRYAGPRMWSGTTFHDLRWGHNWSPTPESPLSLADTYRFAAWLRIQLTDAGAER